MRALTRRAVLAAIPSSLLAERGYQQFAADWRRYPDSATEFEVLRLTDPDRYSSILASRAITRKNDAVIYTSDRGNGSWQAYRLELKSGQSARLTEAEKLDPDSVTLLADDKTVCYTDGNLICSDSGSRKNELASMLPGSSRLSGPSQSEDGQYLFWAETTAGGSVLRKLKLPKGSPETVEEAKGGRILEPLPNPRRATVMWRRENGSLWVSSFEGEGVRQVATPPGNVLQALWAPDGRTILYLLAPAETGKLNSLREQELDAKTDRLIAPTSQFVRFGRNANASVFLGASQSKASPFVLLLLRLTRRELTLCEHRAATPQTTQPQFSPNSQRIVFQSDKDGKPALYTMVVDRLVEKTET